MMPSKEDANALVADIASQLKKSRTKTSGSSSKSSSSSKKRVAKSEDLKSLKEKSLGQLLPFPNNTKEDRTNADARLSQFMSGERSILVDGEEHYYDPKAMRTYTLEEVGSVMGVTRERIRQIEEMALRKMWRALDIMSKREGMTQADWMKILTDSHGDEETIYMP